MSSVLEVDSQEFIAKAAEALQRMDGMKPPEWASLVKTGVHKQRPPSQREWWWIRSASILRKAYIGNPVGVSSLRKVYGGRKNRGHKPERKEKASGAVIRKILQQLEKEGFLKAEKGKGRLITPKGQSFLDGVARAMKK
jgi:small subunit ribosomal protein S19e